MYRKGFVYVQKRYAGILEETDKGYKFTYDKKYLQSNNFSSLEKPLPVSLTLPLRPESFESSFLFPFFDGLIPEGWLLEKVTENWKINQKDRFGVLLIACGDSIGDVSIQTEQQESREN